MEDWLKWGVIAFHLLPTYEQNVRQPLWITLSDRLMTIALARQNGSPESPIPERVKRAVVGARIITNGDHGKVEIAPVRVKVEVEVKVQEQPLPHRLTPQIDAPTSPAVPLPRSASEKPSTAVENSFSQAAKSDTAKKRKCSSTIVIYRDRSSERLRPNLVGRVS